MNVDVDGQKMPMPLLKGLLGEYENMIKHLTVLVMEANASL